ncbi:Ankyrin [Lachnellula subtilissima]|uniref:Ankyrin n=1 Tax=Lachnellula subtilissima TaxID=602034 RepID=A0A8H8S0F9_9HELO|nr:Ankyrin [Lachnellula subtilissima]
MVSEEVSVSENGTLAPESQLSALNLGTSPPPYSSSGAKAALQTSVLDLPGNETLKSMTEEFNKEAANFSLRRKEMECTRCEVLIGPVEQHYGCLRCSQSWNITRVCQKCYECDEICLIHKVELVKRYAKSWSGFPSGQNYVDPTVAKGDDHLIQALKENDQDRVGHFAKDSKLLNAHGDLVHLGYTPLHVAAHLNLEEGARTLIQRGAHLEPKDQWDMTPLLVAVQCGNVGVFKLLLDSGVSITSISGKNASTALHVAASNGMYNIIAYILSRKVPVDLPSGRGTALQIATMAGSMRCVEILLAAGADPNAKEGVFGASLVSAARQERETDGRALCEILLKHGANVDIQGGIQAGKRDEKDLTPLSIAVLRAKCDVLKLLLQYGADIDAKDLSGLTVLMQASIVGHLEVCRVLLDRRASLEGTGTDALSPLIWAVAYGREEVVDLLLERGASAVPPPTMRGKWKALEKWKVFKEVPVERK